MEIYLSDLEDSVRAVLEKEIKEKRPDLAQAVDDGDTIVIAMVDVELFKAR